MHAALNAAMPAAPPPTDGINVNPVLAIIGAILIVLIGWAAVTIVSKFQRQGDTKGASNSAVVVVIGVAVFALAGVVTGLLLFMNKIIQPVIGG